MISQVKKVNQSQNIIINTQKNNRPNNVEKTVIRHRENKQTLNKKPNPSL